MIKYKILILSFYYSPDLSACSFRTSALIKAIQEVSDNNISLKVLTTKPHRYHSFTRKAPSIEEQSNLLIKRFELPEHKGGFLDQTKAFLAFARQAQKEAKGDNYNLIFATSSRLMTAALGAYLSKQLGSNLYLDIRDIFVDTIKDVLSPPFSWILVPIFSFIEKYTINQAQKVNLVSRGFEQYFKKRYPKQNFSFFTNGIDNEFIRLAKKHKDNSALTQKKKDKITVVYAGNIGDGQGLHHIVPKLAQKMPNLFFKIIGEGGKRQELENAIQTSGIKNVSIEAPMVRAELIKEYEQADILFLHLNDFSAFKKVLPSKIFEYAAMGKPIWAGVAGYAAQFIEKEIENAAVFYPCNVNEALKTFNKLDLKYIPRNAFIEQYRRNNIMTKMAKDILQFL